MLINGKRAPQYDTAGDIDVNQIPTALIKRVDVLTGGASAVYGSDAVAGVVNFILDDQFTGLKGDVSSQITGYGDGSTYDASLTGGIKLGDRGYLVVSGGYSQRDAVRFGDRYWGDRVLDSGTPGPYFGLAETGSSNTIPTAFDIPGAGRQQIQSDGTLTSSVVGYNYNPVNIAQVPLKRYNAMVIGDYEVAPNVTAYF